MKKLINEFRMLDSEEQAFFGYGALVLLEIGRAHV